MGARENVAEIQDANSRQQLTPAGSDPLFANADSSYATLLSAPGKMITQAYKGTIGRDLPSNLGGSKKKDLRLPGGYTIKYGGVGDFLKGKSYANWGKQIAFEYAFRQIEKAISPDYFKQNFAKDITERINDENIGKFATQATSVSSIRNRLLTEKTNLENRKKYLAERANSVDAERRSIMPDEELSQFRNLQTQVRDLENQVRRAQSFKTQIESTPVKLIGTRFNIPEPIAKITGQQTRNNLLAEQDQKISGLLQRKLSVEHSPEFLALKPKYDYAEPIMRWKDSLDAKLVAVNIKLRDNGDNLKFNPTVTKWFHPATGKFFTYYRALNNPVGFLANELIYKRLRRTVVSGVKDFLIQRRAQKAAAEAVKQLGAHLGQSAGQAAVQGAQGLAAQAASQAQKQAAIQARSAGVSGIRRLTAAYRTGISAGVKRLDTLLRYGFKYSGIGAAKIWQYALKPLIQALGRQVSLRSARLLSRGIARTRGAIIGRSASGVAGRVVSRVALRGAASGVTAILGSTVGLIILVVLAAVLLMVFIFFGMIRASELYNDNQVFSQEGSLLCETGMSVAEIQESIRGTPMVQKQIVEEEDVEGEDGKIRRIKVTKFIDDPDLLQLFSNLISNSAKNTGGRYTVNPALVLAIGQQETGLGVRLGRGNYDIFGYVRKINPGVSFVGKDDTEKYSDAIRRQFKAMSDEFFADHKHGGHNQRTIVTIAQGEAGDFYTVKHSEHAYAPYDTKNFHIPSLNIAGNKPWLPHGRDQNPFGGVLGFYDQLYNGSCGGKSQPAKPRDFALVVTATPNKNVSGGQTVTININATALEKADDPVVSANLDEHFQIGQITPGTGCTVSGNLVQCRPVAASLSIGQNISFSFTAQTISSMNTETPGNIRVTVSSKTTAAVSTVVYINLKGNPVGQDGRHSFPILKIASYFWYNCHWHANYNGRDIRTDKDGGTPITAVTNGTVRRATISPGPALILEGDDGLSYYYGHLQSEGLVTGSVGIGQVIGFIAAADDPVAQNNGVAHVHFSVTDPKKNPGHTNPTESAGDFLNKVDGTHIALNADPCRTLYPPSEFPWGYR